MTHNQIKNQLSTTKICIFNTMFLPKQESPWIICSISFYKDKTISIISHKIHFHPTSYQLIATQIHMSKIVDPNILRCEGERILTISFLKEALIVARCILDHINKICNVCDVHDKPPKCLLDFIKKSPMKPKCDLDTKQHVQAYLHSHYS